MSGDGHTNETRELNLDALEADFRNLSAYESATRDAGLALIAEVRGLRATVERVDGLASQGAAEQRRGSDQVAANYLHIIRQVVAPTLGAN